MKNAKCLQSVRMWVLKKLDLARDMKNRKGLCIPSVVQNAYNHFHSQPVSQITSENKGILY